MLLLVKKVYVAYIVSIIAYLMQAYWAPFTDMD